MEETNIDSLQNFCDKLKTELLPRTYVKPDLLVVFYKWFYRYSFGGIKPKEITKYYRTKKFIKSFDD